MQWRVETGKNEKSGGGKESLGGEVHAKRETMDAGTVLITVLSKFTYAPKPEAILPTCVGVGATTGSRALNTDFHPSWLFTHHHPSFPWLHPTPQSHSAQSTSFIVVQYSTGHSYLEFTVYTQWYRRVSFTVRLPLARRPRKTSHRLQKPELFSINKQNVTASEAFMHTTAACGCGDLSRFTGEGRNRGTRAKAYSVTGARSRHVARGVTRWRLHLKDTAPATKKSFCCKGKKRIP